MSASYSTVLWVVLEFIQPRNPGSLDVSCSIPATLSVSFAIFLLKLTFSIYCDVGYPKLIGVENLKNICIYIYIT